MPRKFARRSAHTMVEVLERRQLLTACWVTLAGPSSSVTEGATLSYGVSWFWDQAYAPGGTVTLSYGGSATSGVDYTPASTTISIPSNPNPYPGFGGFPFSVQLLADNLVEPAETLVVSLASATGGLVLRPYLAPDYVDVTPYETSTVTISDDPPTVSIGVLDGEAEENAEGEAPNPGSVVVTRSGGNIHEALTVFLSPGGSATFGSDYGMPTTVTIPAESPSASADLTVLDDPDAEGIETAEILVAPDMPHYRQADPNAEFPVRLRIDDNISVRSVRVEVRGAMQNSARGYSFDVRIVVSGEHLDLAEMHQNVKSSSSVWDFNGNSLAPAAVMGFFQGSDPNVIDSNGQWLQDTGWGWGPLNIVPDTNNGLGYGDDHQHTWLGDPAAAFWNVIYLSRYYQFQVCNARTDAILNTTEWGYQWSNWNCAWTRANGAPMDLCASPIIAPAGVFSDIETISGLA